MKDFKGRKPFEKLWLGLAVRKKKLSFFPLLFQMQSIFSEVYLRCRLDSKCVARGKSSL